MVRSYPALAHSTWMVKEYCISTAIFLDFRLGLLSYIRLVDVFFNQNLVLGKELGSEVIRDRSYQPMMHIGPRTGMLKVGIHSRKRRGHSSSGLADSLIAELRHLDLRLHCFTSEIRQTKCQQSVGYLDSSAG